MRRVASADVKVLVTGAAGTVGREITTHLRAAGWSVRAHDRMPLDRGAAEEVARGDLRDPEHTQALFCGVNAVVHGAAIPAPIPDADQEVFANNVLSAFQVLGAAGRAGVPRMVYIS